MSTAETAAGQLVGNPLRKRLRRQLESTIIHFDYDCFYASVFENEDKALKSLPLAVQQKQGLYKLQLISEAKRTCPDVVIVLGEDLTRFRNASKENYAFLASFSWNNKAERLGFDEVFMDVSDIIEYNVGLLNPNDLPNSFFCLSKNEPTAGFAYDASRVAGHTYPELATDLTDASQSDVQRLRMRLTLASHLAKHLRQQLESNRGYTCTVGISTNKLLSKLCGNLHKPDSQTTLLPPYVSNDDDAPENVTSFIDGHEIGKIPGIGFKIAQKLRAHVLQRAPEFDAGLVYGGTKESVLVGDVRRHPGMGPETLERILGGPGTPRDIGAKIWGLINGCDDAEVGLAREVPKQISIEDSYNRLDTLSEVVKKMRMLANSLLNRMHADLLEDEEDIDAVEDVATEKVAKRWLAYPKTLRLSTRPRPPQNPDGSRNRSFARISRSAPMPNFIFSLKESVESLSGRLVSECLVPLFRRLHPEKSGWNLSLVNIAATNMVDAASEKGGVGRDISKMFRKQDEVLKQWRADDEVAGMEEDAIGTIPAQPKLPAAISKEDSRGGSEDFPTPSQEESVNDDKGTWDSEDEEMMDNDNKFVCEQCSAVMPTFAMAAHSRWHTDMLAS